MTATKTIVFRHARLVLPQRICDDWRFTVVGERIIDLKPETDAALPADAQIIDLNHQYLCPGLIDTHIHGILSWHVAQLEHMPQITMAMAAGGATGFLPSVGMLPPGDYKKYLAGIQRYQADPPPGALILGAHFESPYINPQCIAIADEYLWHPDSSEYNAWLDDYPQALRLLTISPELPGSIECIAQLTAGSVAVAVGHSLADQKLIRQAMAAGLKSACHLFNNVPIKFLNRENCLQHPAMDEYALLEDSLYVEVIADGIHVAPGFLQLVRKCKSPDKVILVTDAQPGAGAPAGIFHLPDGRAYRTSPNDVARLVANNHIVGSSITILHAVQGYMRHTGADLPEAVRAASLNPAAMLGMDAVIGSLAPGKQANLLVLDGALEIQAVYIKGVRLTGLH